MIKKLSESIGAAEPVRPGDSWAGHNDGSEGCCPTSDHRKKIHRGTATKRQTITKTFTNGRTTWTSKSYIDHCACRFCGHKFTQEWMPA